MASWPRVEISAPEVADVPLVAWTDPDPPGRAAPPAALIAAHASGVAAPRPSAHHLDLDALAAARPDLILTQRMCRTCAVSVDQVKRSVDQIRAKGSVKYPYLGVSTTAVYPQLNDRFKLGTDDGAWVQEVVDGGPADDAGLEAGSDEVRFQARPYAPGGDVVVKVGNRAIHTENDLGLALTQFQPGDVAPIEIVRKGKRQTVRVKLGERPAQVDQP